MKEQLELKPQDERKGGTSASSAPYDALCPGRHLAQAGLPEKTSDAATFGNEIHAALAANNPEGLDTQQLSIFDSCQEIEAKLVQQVFGAEASKSKSFREQRLWVKVKSDDGHFLHSAKPDVVYRVGPTMLIIEYKTLAGEQQSSPENLQLRDQAVLAARSLVAKEVFTAVVQPLVTHSPELCRYDETSIKQAEEDMFYRVRESNNPKAKRVAGEQQCKYCRASVTCPEYIKWTDSLLPVEPTPSPWSVAMTQWTPEQRAIAAERLPVLTKLLADTKEFLKQALKQDPASVPGFVLKSGMKRSEVNDPETLFVRFGELGGTLDQFMKCVKITKGELEAQVRAVTKKKGKGLLAEMTSLLDGIVEENENESSITKQK